MRPPLQRQPHYVREYRKLVRFLERQGHNENEVAERAVGGNYARVGAMQAELVLDHAPQGPFRLIDVGCGSGRAAAALRDVERLDYLGTDVAPTLLDHARKAAGRPDWRFELVESTTIPAADASADMAMFMSVFTHLRGAEIDAYLGEAARVLKPGGLALCSYLDRETPGHLTGFRRPFRQRLARLLGRDVMISFTTEAELSARLEAAGLAVEKAIKNPQFGHHVLVGRRKT